MARRLQVMFANDDAPILGHDGGNDQTKTATIIPFKQFDPDTEESVYIKETVNTNFVKDIGKAEYDKQTARHKGNKPNYGFIKYNNNYYAVGNAALPYIRDLRERRTSRAKFIREYYGLQFICNLVQMADGNPPDLVHVVAGHPPLNDAMKPDIEKALQGKWDVEFMGERHKIVVGTVFPEDEITSAVLNLRYRIDGTRNPNNNLKQKRTLVVDIGGGTVDVVQLGTNGLPVDGTFDSVEIGIFRTILDFKELFDDQHKEMLRDSASGISLSSIYRVYMDKDHKLRGGGLPGGELDCSDIYEQATSGTLNQLYFLINQMTGDMATEVDQILVAGGAGDLWFGTLSETVFDVYADNGALFLATNERGKGIFSAARGMAKLGTALRRQEYKELQRATP